MNRTATSANAVAFLTASSTADSVYSLTVSL